MKKESWIKIEGPESLPKHSGDVLLLLPDYYDYGQNGYKVGWYSGESPNGWRDKGDGCRITNEVSHWQPIVGPE